MHQPGSTVTSSSLSTTCLVIFSIPLLLAIPANGPLSQGMRLLTHHRLSTLNFTHFFSGSALMKPRCENAVSMRRRDPTELTDRERDVLELLRRDFTNEQIAERLGISLDGAKYHVSQILSKLGVATREEAAAVALGERRRWWAAWPLWAKIAGAAFVASVVGGLALLAWGALRTDSKDG